MFARAMNVLTIENTNLRKELEKARSATVRPFTPPSAGASR
ncbi:unnamed protein product [[Actinomadura] parvosata subsp. kistnae]|nr:unnamed protein product [Actinomadura parvosata subsp. kistnae]